MSAKTEAVPKPMDPEKMHSLAKRLALALRNPRAGDLSGKGPDRESSKGKKPAPA